MQPKAPSHIVKRVYILMGGFVLAAVLVVARMLILQYGQGDYWASMQQKDRIYPKKVLAARGSILADDGSVLAATMPFYRVGLDVTVINPRDYPNFRDSLVLLSEQLAEHFGDGQFDTDYFQQRIQRAMDEQDRHIYLLPYNRLLNYQEMVLLRSFPVFNKGRFKGGLVIESITNQRFYPFQQMARITLGLMRDDTMGFKGIEFAYNGHLRGKDGRRMVQQIAGGVELPLYDFQEVEAQDGYDLVTTLNINFQDVVSSALRTAVQRHKALGGVAILMEVKTGKIKAIANYPETYNLAVAKQYEMGSLFKIPAAMAAIEDRYVRPEDTIETGEGYIQWYDQALRDEKGYGNITFREAFAHSSNVAMSKVVVGGYKAHPQKLFDRLEQFGLTQASGISLEGEPTPYYVRPGNKYWNGTTLPWMSIGYTMKLTPLQMLTYVNAIANDGRMMRPMLVSEIRNNAEVVEQFSPEVLRERICSPSTLKHVRNLMEAVVESGTAKNIRNAQYTIAGKTGTSKKLIGGKYQNQYLSSFVGYFPAENPTYSCIVLIDEPAAGEYYASQVAAPVFRMIADNLYSIELSKQSSGSAPDAGDPTDFPFVTVAHRTDAQVFYQSLQLPIENHPQAELVRIERTETGIRLHPYALKRAVMPNVVGMSAKNALALLENQGVKVRLIGHGKVVKQSLKPGTGLESHTRVELTLSHPSLSPNPQAEE
jgi:cell division protein FtsI (penicillin-binding protein 3)